MIKPSKETLRLQRERDKVKKELQQITYLHPRRITAEEGQEADNRSYSTGTYPRPNHLSAKQEEMLRDLKVLRSEYLKNGGKDPQILAEFHVMERELLDDSEEPLTPSNHAFAEGNVVVDAAAASNPGLANFPPNPLLMASPLFHGNHNLNSTAAKLERELQEIDLYKEKLVAQHELKILELDLKEEAMSMIPEKPNSSTPLLDAQGYPLVYIPRIGLQLRLSHLEGWRKFKPSAIQITIALFDGSSPLQKHICHHWMPNHMDMDDVGIENAINKTIPFANIFPKSSIRVIIDIRFTIGSRKDVPFSWTSFDLFKDESLDIGNWKVALYPHPIVFEASPFIMKKTMTALSSAFLYLQLQDGSADMKSISMATPEDCKLKEAQNTDSSSNTTTSANTQGAAPQILRATLKKKRKDAEKQEEQLPQNLVHQPTTTVKEKVVRDVNAKKFAIGFQLTDLVEFPGLEGDIIVRLVVLDSFPDNRIVAFTSSKTEPGEEDGTYGWQFGYFHEIGSITGLSKRKGLFEIVNKGVVVGSCPIDLFKFSSSEAYDICDGVYNLAVAPSKLVDGLQPVLRVRLYKPKFGPPPIQKFSPKLITPPVTDQAYLFIPARPPAPVELKKIISLTISIDSIRFLPTNVTVPKIYARIFSKNKGNFIKGVDFTNSISLDNSVYNPVLLLSKDIPTKLLDPSCVLVLELYTMEYFSRSTEMVGTCVFSIFATNFDAAAGSSITTINYGAFQVPIFYYRINREFMRNDGNIQKYFRVPCASFLIRVLEKETRKMIDYQERVYQTVTSDAPTEYEALIYTFVCNERKEFSIRDRLLSLGEALPKTARHTDDSLITWLDKKFEADAKEPMKIRMIDLSFVTTYNPYYGFKISIDFANNLTQRVMTFPIISFAPSFYVLGEKPVAQKFPDDTMYSMLVDYDSSIRNPKWKDGYHWYRNRQSDRDLIAIIQLLGVSVNQSSGQVDVSSQGWAMLPIFASDLFVRHGYFKIPLFEGFPSKEGISSCWKEGEFELDDGIHSKALKFTSKFGSVSVRLCDGRRGGELDPMFSQCQEEFLGTYAARFKTNSYSSDTISSLKYRKQSLADFDKQMAAAFVEATNLPFVPF